MITIDTVIEDTTLFTVHNGQLVEKEFNTQMEALMWVEKKNKNSDKKHFLYSRATGLEKQLLINTINNKKFDVYVRFTPGKVGKIAKIFAAMDTDRQPKLEFTQPKQSAMTGSVPVSLRHELGRKRVVRFMNDYTLRKKKSVWYLCNGDSENVMELREAERFFSENFSLIRK